MAKRLTLGGILALALGSTSASAQDWIEDWNGAIDALDSCTEAALAPYDDSVIAEPLNLGPGGAASEEQLANATPLNTEQKAVFETMQEELAPCRDGFVANLSAIDPLLAFPAETTFALQNNAAEQLLGGVLTPGDYLQARGRLGAAYREALGAVFAEVADANAGSIERTETSDAELRERIAAFLNLAAEG